MKINKTLINLIQSIIAVINDYENIERDCAMNYIDTAKEWTTTTPTHEDLNNRNTWHKCDEYFLDDVSSVIYAKLSPLTEYPATELGDIKDRSELSKSLALLIITVLGHKNTLDFYAAICARAKEMTDTSNN